MTPRPDKPINRGSDGGSLDAPTSRPRAQVWTKYGEAGREGSSALEVTIDDITVIADTDEAADDATSFTKYEQRSMPGHAKVVAAAQASPDEPDAPEARPMVREWVSERSIDGRLYRRIDAATFVEAPDPVEEPATSWVDLT